MRSFIGRSLSLFAIVAIVSGAMALFSSWLDLRVAQLYEEKQEALSCINDEQAKFKGSAWIQSAAKHASCIFLGTSELATPAEGGFKSFFPNKQYPDPISAIGRPHVQNLLHAMDIGANQGSFQGKRLVIFESLQWFFGTDIPTDGFMANFSEFQFYEFLKNPQISVSNKRYLCQRFLELEAKRSHEQSKSCLFQKEYEYPQTHLLATLYLSDTLAAQATKILLQPYFWLKFMILKIKDSYDSSVFFANLAVSEKKKASLRDLTIPFERERFDKQHIPNAIQSTDNEFFKKSIEPVWERDACPDAKATVLESKEWGDYAFFLSICKELGVVPFIVNLPTNGRYYDHVGIPSSLRQQYFIKNAEVNNKNGISYFDGLKDREYEPFLFYDEVHLSSKGWRYVSEAIINHWK